ncbi:LysR family transcriptional regulator [Microlunatus sp. GCM10028923]|uniref:LysR family transcriptional regulator n=1 Tax=Microlunatus sp. GCM10028923 TaxID=3273400 RepID=UPI00360E1CD3
MEMQWITTFLTIVDRKGFGRAAQQLGYSQPTVSNHVAALERELGASVLHRNCRPVELTQAGAVFLPHARALAREIEAARGSVSDVLGIRRGTVTLGAYPSAMAAYVPGLLSGFRAWYPDITVRLIELQVSDLSKAALSGHIDLVILPQPQAQESFSGLPLWQERYKVVFRSDHPLAEHNGPIPLQTLTDFDLIMPGCGELASPNHPLWHELGTRPPFAFEVIQPQSLLELVRHGLGVGVTNELSLGVAAASGLETRHIDADSAVRDVWVWWTSGQTPSPAGQELLACMRDGARPVGTRRLR